jgi:chaperonin cofactor prefoldin
MTTLKETLSLVQAMAPALSGHLAPILQEGTKVQQSVQAFLHDLEEKRAEAAQDLAQLHAALLELKAEAADEHAHLDAGAQAVEAALQESLHAMETDEGELNHGVDAVGAATRGLESHLTEGGSSARAAEGDAKQALTSLAGAIHSGQAELEGALKAVSDEAQALEHAVEETQTAVGSELTGLRDRMKNHLEEARGRVAHTLDKLRELRTTHEARIRETAADLASRKDHLIEELRQQAETDLKQRIETATARVMESLDRLSHAATEARACSQRAREDVHTEFEELKQAMPPLERALESVKQAANEVGINWR